jgi:hypothetical protein
MVLQIPGETSATRSFRALAELQSAQFPSEVPRVERGLRKVDRTTMATSRPASTSLRSPIASINAPRASVAGLTAALRGRQLARNTGALSR